MRFFYAVVSVILVVVGLAESPLPLMGQPPKPLPADSNNNVAGTRSEVARLLATGWTRSIQARKDAQEQYERLSAAAPPDGRIVYAYALVQIYQYRYADAVKLLDRVLEMDSKNVEAAKLRLWVGVLLKDYDRSLGRMQKMTDALPAEATDPKAEAPNAETAALLGRLAGFLEGPVQSSVNKSAFAATIGRLDTQLTGKRKDAFQKGRRAVLRQFAALDEERDITKAAAVESSEKIKQKVVADLKEQSADLAAKLEAEQTRLADLRKSMGYELEKIDGEMQTANQRLQQATMTAGDASLRAQQADVRVAEFLDLANRERDPNLQQQYLLDAARWRLERDQRAAFSNEQARHVDVATGHVRQLQQQRIGVETRWQRESGGAAKLEGSLKRTLKDKDRYAKKKIDSNNAQTADQQRRSTALATYVPLPVVLEEEKERIIRSFDGQ